MATMKEITPMHQVFAEVGNVTKDGKRVRTVDPLGKDRVFLQAIADLALGVGGTTNKVLQTNR